MASHKAYATKLELQFPLLSDTTKDVCRDYGVLKPILGFISRTVLAVNQDLNIIYRQNGMPPMAEVIAAISRKEE